MHIIVDGYNLIRQSPELFELDRRDIQTGRDALIDMLSAYHRLKRHPITIVFDGINAPLFSRRQDRVKGIRIVFSRTGETADTVIKRMAAREREKALVVSSDRAVVDRAASSGAATISSPAFEDKIRMAAFLSGAGATGEDEDTGWIPTTRKKGPSRRLRKRDRRSRRKIKKL